MIPPKTWDFSIFFSMGFFSINRSLCQRPSKTHVSSVPASTFTQRGHKQKHRHLDRQADSHQLQPECHGRMPCILFMQATPGALHPMLDSPGDAVTPGGITPAKCKPGLSTSHG